MDKETIEEAAKIQYGSDQFLWAKKRDAFIKGAKWQQERSYSEEEVIDLLYKKSIYQDHFESDAELREWFEQFKKK